MQTGMFYLLHIIYNTVHSLIITLDLKIDWGKK